MKEVKEVSTFCRVCEPVCGVLATVEDGRITKIRSNPDHVLSRGHFCKKAMGAVDITYDQDRITLPMKRCGGPGEFEAISWEQAFQEICDRLKASRQQHGDASFAIYSGNPPAFSSANMIATNVFANALDIKWQYNLNAEDGVHVVVACEVLYGKSALTKPDFWRSTFALIVGANPVGSHGSIMCEPVVGKALKSIVDRGGRVVCVDPYCSDTAHRFEHQPILAGSDPYFLAALLRELIDAGFVDDQFIANHTRDFVQLCAILKPCTAQWAQDRCGISADRIRSLAEAFGSAESASIYGRTGTCTQRHGTLSNMLIQLIAIVTGNLDSPGGLSFGAGFLDYSGPRFGSKPSRATGLPDVSGSLPSAALAYDIEEPGAEQVRSLLMIGANPVLAAPVGKRLSAALQKLDLFFSLDIYINETNRHADYVLPCATMWEREDVPFLAMMGMMLRPSAFATPAVIARQGEVKEEWEILYELCRRMGREGALTHTPREILDDIIRNSEYGDKFGESPEGLTYDKLLSDYPNGVELMPHMPVGIIDTVLATADKRIPLAAPEFVSEMKHLMEDEFFEDPQYPLRLHSLREVLTHNSWMHNADSLAKSNWPHYARLNEDDAQTLGIDDGSIVTIRSPYGEVAVEARISGKVSRGNVALPHGWGHEGGWQIANRRGGVNSNILASDRPDDSDRISGGSVLNGIPVQVLVGDVRRV
jgi:anaerobic selenocysteine-containing dehydrogenase